MSEIPETYEFDAPAAWARLLLDGDGSSMSVDDIEHMVSHFANRGGHPDRVIDCSAITYYGRFRGQKTEMATYTAVKE